MQVLQKSTSTPPLAIVSTSEGVHNSDISSPWDLLIIPAHLQNPPRADIAAESPDRTILTSDSAKPVKYSRTRSTLRVAADGTIEVERTGRESLMIENDALIVIRSN